MKNIAIVGFILILALLFWRRKKAQANPPVADTEAIVEDSLLGLGSSGLDVKRLQMKLNELVARAVNEEIPLAYTTDGINWNPVTQPLVVDGKFGKATEMMLYVITGRKSVKASEIDSLSIALT